MKISIQGICEIGMFAAVISILSILQIPTPSGVPFTFQTFAIVLCGYVLGSGKGVVTTGLYILLGTVGIPVYSGMKAGVGVLVGPTGGYLAGFLFLSFFAGKVGTQLNYKGFFYGMAGLVSCHILGSLQLKWIMGISFPSAVMIGSLPYIFKDILMAVMAVWVGKKIKQRLNK